MAESDLQPGAEDITAALRELGVEESVITAALHMAAKQRQERPETGRWSESVRMFAVAWKRTQADHASDSNIEGWYEDLGDSAYGVLMSGMHYSEKTALQQQGLAAAAATFIYLAAELDMLDGYDEADLQVLFRSNGLDPDELRGEFKAKFTERYNGNDPADIEEIFSTFENMSGRMGGDPEFWNMTVRSKGDDFYDALQASGFELPALGDDGLYDDEREEF